MKKLINVIGLCSLLVFTGCGGLLSKNEGVSGKSTKLEEKAHDRVNLVNEQLVENDKQKLNVIGIFASGTEHALSKIPDPTEEINVAREMNSRIVSLTSPPNLDQLKEVYEMVDNLISTLQSQREKGLKSLSNKDETINDIQIKKKALTQIKDQEIKKYMDMAQTAASKADQYAETLGDMDSMWGLGAVFYGIKRFFMRAFTFISIFLFIYLVLRVLATVHPAGAAAFQIFDLIASVFINIIKGLAPGAAKIAKLVPEATSDLYKQTLSQMVGKIETLIEKDKDDMQKGQPLKKYSLEDILKEFSQTMDRPNKDVITDIKKDIKK